MPEPFIGSADVRRKITREAVEDLLGIAWWDAPPTSWEVRHVTMLMQGGASVVEVSVTGCVYEDGAWVPRRWTAREATEHEAMWRLRHLALIDAALRERYSTAQGFRRLADRVVAKTAFHGVEVSGPGV